uniref:Uncharacterized protein n=1 Tax=Anguilla anguilla TaxID=7936 RepID=A0A0E9VJE6_ANGAN
MKGWGVKLRLENNSPGSWESVCAYWIGDGNSWGGIFMSFSLCQGSCSWLY